MFDNAIPVGWLRNITELNRGRNISEILLELIRNVMRIMIAPTIDSFKNGFTFRGCNTTNNVPEIFRIFKTVQC